MRSLICTLYNSTTGHHSVPLVFENKEQAVHTFISEIQAPNSELANIKDTLSIFATGHFDHKTGSLHPFFFSKKQLLLAGKEVKLLPSSETTTSQKETV